MGALTKYKKMLKQRLTSFYYEYLNNDFSLDVDISKKYNSTRKDYERFKEKHKVRPTNIIIKEVKEGKSTKYIKEVKETRHYIDDNNLVLEKALDEFYDILSVNDKENFIYFYTQYNIDYTSFTSPSIEEKIDNLEEIIYTYEDDEEFKKYLDKIIK
jgi:hypothetical protein